MNKPNRKVHFCTAVWKGQTVELSPSTSAYTKHLSKEDKVELFPSSIYGPNIGIRVVTKTSDVYFYAPVGTIRTLLDMIEPTSSETEGVQQCLIPSKTA